MKRIALALLLLGIVAPSTTYATDLPVKAPIYKAPPAIVAYRWSGLYAGGFVGGGFGSEDPTDINEYAFQNLASVPRSGIYHHWAYDMTPGVLAGGTIGLNYQMGQMVLGIEGEGGYIHLHGSGADQNSPGQDVVSSSTLGDWYGIIAGRVGYAMDRTLLYAKGGVVFTHEEANVVDSCVGNGTPVAPCGPLTINATGSNDEAAWVAGGGIEYAFDDHWSAKAEYLYWALDNTFNVGGVASNGGTFVWEHSFSGLHTVKIGINYRFMPF